MREPRLPPSAAEARRMVSKELPSQAAEVSSQRLILKATGPLSSWHSFSMKDGKTLALWKACGSHSRKSKRYQMPACPSVTETEVRGALFCTHKHKQPRGERGGGKEGVGQKGRNISRLKQLKPTSPINLLSRRLRPDLRC